MMTQATRTAPREFHVAQKTSRPQIHVIDDDPDVSRTIQLRLDQYGIKVTQSFDASGGLTRACETKPDVIVTDLLLPDDSGACLISRLQRSEHTCETPIIVLSGQSDPKLRKKVEALGIADYLSKPLNFDQLLRSLRRYIPLSVGGSEGRTYFIHPPHRFIRRIL